MNDTAEQCWGGALVWHWRAWQTVSAWLLNGVATTAVALVGVCANVYSVSLLRSFRIRASIIVYLATLALFDAAVCASALAFYALIELLSPFVHNDYRNAAQYIMVVFNPISNWSMTTAFWIVLVIAVERYRAVADPLLHRATDTRCRAKTICATTVSLAALYCLPMIFELRVFACFDASTNTTVKFADATALRLDDTYQLVYIVICNVFFITVGPFLAISFLSYRIICFVNSARQRRDAMQNKSLLENSGRETTTLMLLTVAAKFLLLNCPQIVVNVWEKLDAAVVQSDAFISAINVSGFLIVLNSATNCLVYLRWRSSLSRARGDDIAKAIHHSTRSAVSLFGAHQQRAGSHSAADFSFEEAEALRATWLAAVDQHGTKEAIGAALLQLMANGRVDGQWGAPAKGDVGDAVGDLLNQLVFAAGDDAREAAATRDLRRLALLFRDRRLVVNAQAWTLFRANLVAIMTERQVAAVSPRVAVRGWTKVACTVIREAKLGSMTDGPSPRSSPRSHTSRRASKPALRAQQSAVYLRESTTEFSETQIG